MTYRPYLSFIFVSVFLLLTSCIKHATPQDVALNFMHAIQQSNFELAKKYATKESQQVISLYAIFDDRRNPAEREKIRQAEISIVNHEEKGDQATVTVLNSSSKKEELLNLVKESGQWKISLTLESIIPSSTGAGPNDSVPAASPYPADSASGAAPGKGI